MKQLRLCILLLLDVLLVAACGNRRMSDMQQKLDSIARVETIEQLEMQGIHIDKDITYDLVKFMNFEGRTDPKAIALPETAGTRLMILAADEGDGLYSLWLYSLDDDYIPVDKLCLYATNKEEQKENELADPEDKLIQDFVITSDYEVRLTDYSGKFKAEVQKVYHVDMSRKFSEDQEIDYEQNSSDDAFE